MGVTLKDGFAMGDDIGKDLDELGSRGIFLRALLAEGFLVLRKEVEKGEGWKLEILGFWIGEVLGMGVLKKKTKR